MSDLTDAPDASAAVPDPDPDRSGAGRPADGRRRPVAPIAAAVLAVVVGLLFWVLLTAGADPGADAETPLLDRPAPAAVGSYADGTPFELSRRKGSWVVLNFFTHNCVPCIEEHPELIEFVEQQRRLGTQGAEFYSIVQTSTEREVDEYFDEHGGDWPVVYDDRYDFQLEFGVAQVPETWIIDPNGIVRGRWIGAIDDADTLSASVQSMREALSPGGGS